MFNGSVIHPPIRQYNRDWINSAIYLGYRVLRFGVRYGLYRLNDHGIEENESIKWYLKYGCNYGGYRAEYKCSHNSSAKVRAEPSIIRSEFYYMEI